jgi:hypothetical protein
MLFLIIFRIYYLNIKLSKSLIYKLKKINFNKDISRNIIVKEIIKSLN